MIKLNSKSKFNMLDSSKIGQLYQYNNFLVEER